MGNEILIGDIEKNDPNSVVNQEEKINSQWIYHGEKICLVGKTFKSLDSGFYTIGFDTSAGIYLEKKPILTDELYELPSDELTDIIDDIQKFWQNEKKYEEYNLIHKRGILMYGKPGGGKTGIINLCVKYLINELNGIVINISSGDQASWFIDIAPDFRKIEKDRPLIVIMEDIDSIINEGYWSTSMLLNILDGTKQINNVVYIATTNYPEKLEDRVTNRPSRFDRRYEIEMPNAEVRESYIRKKVNHKDIEKIDIQKWVHDTENMSIAHLRELIISVLVMGYDYQSSINHLKGLKTKPKIKDTDSKKIGF